MPRLTDTTYLQTYQTLHAAWISDATSLFLLDAMEQWVLHDYFRFSESLDEAALIAHRRAVTASGSSLPQRAGRAYARLTVLMKRLEDYQRAAPLRVKPKKNAEKKIVVFGEVHPSIDVDKFAKILYNYRPRDK